MSGTVADMYREAAERHKAEVIRLRRLGRYIEANLHADAAAACYLEAGYTGADSEIAERLARYVG